jgi:hypothetical protein
MAISKIFHQDQKTEFKWLSSKIRSARERYQWIVLGKETLLLQLKKFNLIFKHLKECKVLTGL